MKKNNTRNFKQREDNNNRIEALSDGVFALAIAITLLSANSPSNYDELRKFVIDLIPFGLSIIFIFWVWREQKNYFRRFALYDRKSTNLNLLLLFFTISYAFPLKFLMSWIINFFSSLAMGNMKEDYAYFNSIVPFEKLNSVMIIYGLGFILVFGTLHLMYRYAYSKREDLNLSKVEKVETLWLQKVFLMNVGIGCFSVGLSLLGRFFNWNITPFFAGISYNLVWIINVFQNKSRIKKLEKLDSK